MRTSSLLRVANRHILIDAGPDFRMQALAHSVQHLDAVLLTHSHYDHVSGLDDLRPLTEDDQAMPIYANRSTINDIRVRLPYAFLTNTSDGSSRPSLDMVEIQHYQPFSLDGIQILPLDVMHGTWTITGYRIGRLGYITDVSALPVQSMELLADLDVLVLGALRYDPHPTHMTIEQAVELIALLQPRRAFLVHMSHAVEHAAANAQLPPGVMLAYDGLEVEIAES